MANLPLNLTEFTIAACKLLNESKIIHELDDMLPELFPVQDNVCKGVRG